jgi:hypothetical protein
MKFLRDSVFDVSLNPIKMFADVVPFLGTMVGVAGLVALALTSVTIVLVWALVRPLLVGGTY